MHFGISLIQAQECVVCLQLRDDDAVYQTAIEAKLYGAVAFAVCPCCRMRADPKDPEYMERAQNWLSEREPS